MPEDFRLLAAVIAAHPDRQVIGRTRLQKTVKLLQSLGMPTNFSYTIHFYGPYSEGLHATIGLLEKLGLITEAEKAADSPSGNVYYTEKALDDANADLVSEYQPAIALMAATPPDILELAATYQAFREQGATETDAMERLRRKKASKCVGDNVDRALKLLRQLRLEPAA